MALQLRSQLCTFENSTNCNEILFDPHSFSEELKGLLLIRSITPLPRQIIGLTILVRLSRGLHELFSNSLQSNENNFIY